jgi:CheY-like chemotaxis protein
VRVVCITGRDGLEDRQRSAAAGAEAHLIKPVDPAYVERLVSGDE